MSVDLQRRGWVLIAVVGLSWWGPQQSWGQAAAPTDESAGQLQDIIVTAQRRSERLQDVPVAISVVTAETIAKMGITGTTALQQTTPGLDITQQGSGATPFLRGVGSPDGTAGSASSVGIYVDGVYMAAQSAELFAFNDIERIEVLKGPQGTLFGENTTGGAIQILTKDPSHTPSADIGFGFANYRTYRGSLYATTGITDNVAIDVSAYANDSLDGWGHNLVSGNDAYRANDYGIRSKLLWTPDSATEVRLSADYSQARSGLGISTMLVPGALSFDGVTTNHGFYNITSGLDPYLTQQFWGGNLNIQHDFDPFRLVSISAYREETTFYRFDYTGTPESIVHADDFNPQHDISQELQLQSLANSRFKWILGGFFLHSSGIRTDVYTGAAYPPPDYYLQGDYQNTTYAGFGQATAEVYTDTRLTAGLRYTKDKRDATSFNTIGTGPVFNALAPPDLTYSKVTYRVSLDHNWTPDVMTYASFNTGFKSGQFNLNGGLNFPPVLPENLKAYEVGLKSEFLDRRVRVNAAVFDYDYNDIQVSFLTSAGQQTLNAAAAKIKGIDGDITLVASPNLTFNGGASYLHGRYTNFPNAPAEFLNPVPPDCVTGGSCGGTTAIPGGVNGDGLHTIHTPTFSGFVGVNYNIETSVGKFDVNGNFSYTDAYFVEVDNRLEQPAQRMLNASAGYTVASGAYEVRLWGKNLLAQEYYSFLFSATPFGDEGVAAPPRTYGIDLFAHFK